MQKTLYGIVFSLLLVSCGKQEEKVADVNEPAQSALATVIPVDSSVATVRIAEYTLIQGADEDRRADAADIITLKHTWPLVMQSPNTLGFDTILAKNFTFFGEGRLMNRADYINNRLSPSDWKITFVKYDNLTLQFFESTALLTYQNKVTNENVKTGEVEIEHINWADVYVKEAGKWRIAASHTIDVRIEKVR